MFTVYRVQDSRELEARGRILGGKSMTMRARWNRGADCAPASTRRRCHRVSRCGGAALAALFALGIPARAQEALGDLSNKSIEDLMNIEVTSVSRKEQKLSRTASAVFVINGEDIRRSGATNIPDLLRMVPGVDVAQINANTWAISARGLTEEFGNELLVMVDGRNVYTPTTGGVFWDVVDVPIENIERIEVIRGPGGSVWGANAVNGVVNIITKKAGETPGAMVVAGGGNLDQGFATTQYGGKLGSSTQYRVYSKYFNQNHMPDLNGQNGNDGWHMLRGGFRADSKISPKDTLMVQGDMYTGKEGFPTTQFPSVTSPATVNVVSRVDLAGGFLQSVWNHTYSTRSDMSLLFSYDAYERGDLLNEQRRTFNLEFQNHIAWGRRQDIVWGAGYRYSDSRSDGSLSLSLNPANLKTHLFSAFVQDEISLVPDHVSLTLGTKLEHNYYTGFGLMPTARISYTPTAHQAIWAAVSRALRTPAETDAALRIDFAGFTGPGGVPVIVAAVGNPHVKDEGSLSYEAGYRTALLSNLSIDVAAYYNHYDHQNTDEPGSSFFENTPPPAHLVLPFVTQNLSYGETHGMEIATNWKVNERWTLAPGFEFERIHMHASPGSLDTSTAPDTEGSDPHFRAQLRSHVAVTSGLGWDLSAYYVGRLVALSVPSYTRLDTGLTWRWSERLSLSVVGQNLLKDRHLEFVSDFGANSTSIKRSGYAKLTWQY
jgi:iron complex outermembrane recepter protein